MVDLVGLASLFFEVSKKWTEPKVVIIDPLSEAENEPFFQKAKAEGHQLAWPHVSRIRKHQRDGWKPVAERDKIGRPTIFMDRNKELILMHRPQQRKGPSERT